MKNIVKHRYLIFGLSIAILSLTIYLLCGSSASAVENNSFNIITSPLPINLQGPPGTTLETDIRVKNGGTNIEKLKVSLMKFSAYGDEGKPSIQDRAPGDDYFDWVTFTPQSFDAPPNVWMTIKMSINLPKTAAFGYYYAAIISRSSQPQRTNGKQSVLVGSTAVLALVDAQVPGANRTATITSFTADKRFYEFLPATFTVKIHNSGNIHLIPSGNIFINRNGKLVTTIGINSVAGNVLPNSNRIFSAEWNDGFPVYAQKEVDGKVVLDSKSKPVKSLQWDFSKASHLRFGHYSAHLVMAYDNGNRDVPLEATVSFWVIPWRLIGGGLLLLILAGAGVWSIVHKIYKKVPKKMKLRDEKIS